VHTLVEKKEGLGGEHTPLRRLGDLRVAEMVPARRVDGGAHVCDVVAPRERPLVHDHTDESVAAAAK